MQVVVAQEHRVNDFALTEAARRILKFGCAIKGKGEVEAMVTVLREYLSNFEFYQPWINKC